MAQHCCDRSGALWPFAHAKGAPRGLQRPALYLAAAYSATRADGVYTLRSQRYVSLFHALLAGPDPLAELQVDRVRTRRSIANLGGVVHVHS
jgi:hypothetical protein